METSQPLHIGIIMDGNGRWAQKRGLPRTKGHKEGLTVAKNIVATAAEMGIACLSLYAFSTENWKRAQSEVSFLMSLIKTHLKKEFDFYKKNGIRVVHSGDRSGLADDILKEIEEVEKVTASFKGLTVNLLINYGGCDEIVRASNRYITQNPGKQITAKELTANLDNPDIPPVDLLIRTGGDQRISNFLIWESAYAELFFSPKFWPDWKGEDLRKAVEDFTSRERRFGGIG